MDSKFPPGENSAKDDFEVSPDSGGLAAASFKAPRAEQSLGGGGPKPAEQLNSPESLQKPGVKTVLSTQRGMMGSIFDRVAGAGVRQSGSRDEIQSTETAPVPLPMVGRYIVDKKPIKIAMQAGAVLSEANRGGRSGINYHLRTPEGNRAWDVKVNPIYEHGPGQPYSVEVNIIPRVLDSQPVPLGPFGPALSRVSDAVTLAEARQLLRLIEEDFPEATAASGFRHTKGRGEIDFQSIPLRGGKDLGNPAAQSDPTPTTVAATETSPKTSAIPVVEATPVQTVETPKPKAEETTPTRISRGFLDRIGQRIKNLRLPKNS